jgi:5-methylcytosine-specific restriction endonuclease McrA
MFIAVAYCTQVLRLSERAAYHRIEAARAARQYPVILERALVLLVDQLEKTKTAKTSRPRRTSTTCAKSSAESRHIPAPVRRAVWVRDEGRCAFVGPHGRCMETGCLEYHHVIPFARGGSTDDDEHRRSLPRAQQL